MLESFGRDGFSSPDMMLLTPASAEVSTDVRLEVLPIVAKKTMETNHFDVTIEFIVVIVPHGTSENVHLGTWSEENCTSDEIGIEIIFEI